MHGESYKLDPSGNFLEVKCEAMWSADFAKQHFAEVGPLIANMRRTRGSARVLIDLSSAPVQSLDTITSLSNLSEGTYHTGDRIAVVCDSMLLTMQFRRLTNYPAEFFKSRSDAVAWLSDRN
jgi:di/tripeptidase